MKISEDPKLNNTYINRMINNIVDNIKIRINNLAIIHEDEHSHRTFNFFSGFQLKELSIESINNEPNKEERVTKGFQIVDLLLFMIPIEHENTVNFELTVNGNNNALYQALLSHSKHFKSNSNTVLLKDYLLVNPLNLRAIVRRGAKNINVQLDIDSVEIQIERKQFACALKLSEFISKYNQFYNNCYFYRRVKFFKPELLSVSDDLHNTANNKKAYCIQFLKHYFTAVHKLVQEKRYKVPKLFINTNDMKEFKTFFIQKFPKFYLNESSLNREDSHRMRQILKYVDKEILYEWIKEVVGEIYTEEKKAVEKSGFFGGLKSYFYTSAVENIKYDEKMHDIKEMAINVVVKVNFCCFSFSELYIRNNNKIRETSKFVIKDIMSIIDKELDNLAFDCNINEFKFAYITRMNESAFTYDIIIPLEKVTESDRIFTINYKSARDVSDIKVNLYSQAFIYNQNFIETITRFFNISEFDQISSLIKSADLLSFDIESLQKISVSSKDDTKSSSNSISIDINNQSLIFPLVKNKAVSGINDAIILQLGHFSMSNTNPQVYKAQINKINIQYFSNLDIWILNHKTLASNDIKTPNANYVNILEDFSLKFKLSTAPILQILCEISKININVNKFIVGKFFALPEIFNNTKNEDIWENVYENKNQIANNSLKKGFVFLKTKNNLFVETWAKYYCLLSGGYLYLFEKSENLKPDVLISLKDASVEDIEVTHSEEQKRGFTITYPNSSQVHPLMVANEALAKEWKRLIQNRVEEIKSYSAISSYDIKLSEENVDQAFKLSMKEDAKLNSNEKSRERLNKLIELFNRDNLQNRLHFGIKLDSFSISLFDSEDISDSSDKFVLRLDKFECNFTTNELLIDLKFSQKNVNFYRQSNNSITSSIPNVFDIFYNNLTEGEQLINVHVIMYNREIYEYIIKEKDLLLEYSKEAATLRLLNISKLNVDLFLSNMTLIFNPNIIKNLLTQLRSLSPPKSIENINGEDNYARLQPSLERSGFSSTSIGSAAIGITQPLSQTNRNSLIRMTAVLKSLDLVLMNKRTDLKLFSFNLSESRAECDKFETFTQAKLNLGNFKIVDSIGFPQNIKSDSFTYKNKEILGLADKNSKSSLFLNIIIYNSKYTVDIENKRLTTELEIKLESMRLNVVYKVILRLIDSIKFDIIESFKTEDTGDSYQPNSQLEESSQSSIRRTKNNVEYMNLNILIDNPKFVLSDINSDAPLYELNFGNISIKNEIDIVDANLTYFERYLIDFKDTHIKAKDGFNICEPLNMQIIYSSINYTNNFDNGVENLLTFNIDKDTHISKSLNIFVKIFDFQVRGNDYLNILLIADQNLNMDDLNDDLLFEKLREKEEFNSNPGRKESSEDLINDSNSVVNGNNNNDLNNRSRKDGDSFSMEFVNDIFKIKLIDEEENFLQFFLVEGEFKLKSSKDLKLIHLRSRNIFIKDNTISVLSNKKGVEKIVNLQNYSQMNLHYREDLLNKIRDIDLSLIDLKFLVKFDLIDFLSKFFEKGGNKNTKIIKEDVRPDEVVPIIEPVSIDEDWILKVNATILNNVIFLRSQEHFSEQYILACEGDIIIDLDSSKILSTKIVESTSYKATTNLALNLNLQNFIFYSIKIFNFESDFDDTFNKRILIDSINLFADIKSYSVHKNISPEAKVDDIIKSFEKSEIFVEMDKIRVKFSYEDFFFIHDAIMLNLRSLKSGENDQNQKVSNEVEVLNKTNPVLNKFENKLELFLNIPGIEVFIINDLNEMFCPILEIKLTNLDNVLLLDLNSNVNLQSNSQILINYFNYKISIWEPAIENLDLKLVKEGKNLIVKSQKKLQLNISTELIVLLKSSIKSFKTKYNKSNRLESKAISVSNHMVINYSGEDIILKKSLWSGGETNVRINNGESFDIHTLINSDQRLDVDREFKLNMQNSIDEIKFEKSKFTLDHFQLNSTSSESEEEQRRQLAKLNAHDLIYNMELHRIRRNYVFYSKYILHNRTDFEFVLIDEDNKETVISKNNRLGIPVTMSSGINLKLNNDLIKLHFEDSQVIINSKTFKITYERERLNYMKQEEEITIITLNPSIIVENFLPFDITMKNLETNDYCVIKDSESRNLYLEVKNRNFYTLSTKPDVTSKEVDFYFTDSEITQIVSFTNSLNGEIFEVKVTTTSEKGLNKIYIYADYLIVNTTNYHIKPISPKEINSLNNSSNLALEEGIMNDKELSRFTHKLDNAKKFEFYFVKSFDQNKFVLYDSNGFKYESDTINIQSENYAFVKEILLTSNGSENNSRSYQLYLERVVKYVKMDTLRKIDLLLIKPKYSVSNQTQYDLIINDDYTIPAYSEDAINSREDIIKLLIKDEGLVIGPSEVIDISSSNRYLNYCQIVLKSPSKLYFFNISLNTVDLVTNITISETSYSNSNMIIENRTRYFINVFQVTENNDDRNILTLAPHTNSFFNWSKINIKKYLKIDLFENSEKAAQPEDTSSLDYYLMTYDNLIDSFSEDFKYKFEKLQNIDLKVSMVGNKQRFVFEEVNTSNADLLKLNAEDESLKPVKDQNLVIIDILSQLMVHIDSISVSVINYKHQSNSRTELLNMSLTNLYLIYILELRNNQNKFKVLEVKLGDLQLDNLTGNINNVFKVNLFKIKSTIAPDNTTPLIHSLLEFKLNNLEQISSIEKIDFLIQSFGICLDSEFLNDVFKFVKSFNANVEDSLYYHNLNDILNVVNRKSTNVLQSDKSADKIFIKYLRTSPINFLLSYKNINNSFFNELNIRSNLVKNVIDVFSNNDRVNIQLKAIEMNKVFGNSNEIVNRIVQYYYYNLISQTLKLFFSIDILGNPLNLLENLGSGVKDFFYLPIQGFIAGPYEFLHGSLSGTKSLVSHTVGGALDSTQKITSSIGKNLLKLTNSEDYIKERQEIMISSANNEKGKFVTGTKIILLGIKYGVRDFLLLPYLYYRRRGLLYLPKGIYLGLASIFVKPLTGLLDFLSFFSGNIAKRFLQSYEKTISNIKPQREKRIFWGSNRYIRELDKDDMIINKLLIELETEISKPQMIQLDKLSRHTSYIVKRAFFFRNAINNHVSLALFLNSSVVLYDVYTQMILAVVEISKINDVLVDDNTVTLSVEQRSQIMLLFDQDQIKENFLKYMLLLWKHFK